MEMDDKEAYKQRLKAAVHYTVGKICQSTAAECDKQISKQAMAAIAETTFRQCEIFAKDLEAFARHAKRQTVTVDDVKLLARRSAALFECIEVLNERVVYFDTKFKKESSHMQQKCEELALNNQELKERRKKNAAKRKSKEMEEEEEN